MDERGPLRLTVAPADGGRPLLELASAALGDERRAAELIARGGLWLDGARSCDPGAPAPVGASLALHTPPGGVYPRVEVTADLVLFDDGDLIALDKPPGVYVEATPWDLEGNLRVALERFLAERGVHVHLAHRLDRDTSGVLLLSCRPELNAALQRAFAGRVVRKAYLALCTGDPPFDELELTTGHGRTRGGAFRVFPAAEVGQARPGGAVKPMVTRFVVLRRLGDAALLRAEPLTGRTHQIRLHLAHLGHPLLGDVRYGGPGSWRGEPLAHHRLHALRLELPHPRDGAPLAITAPPPPWASGLA